MRFLLGIKMRQNRHHREQVADEMAARIAEKSAGVRKIPRQKTDERAAHQKTRDGDEIFAVRGGDERKNKRANRADARAQAVHVVHEIEGVDDGEQPKNRDGVTEKFVVNKERDALAGSGDGNGDYNLPDEFRQRLQLMFVVQPAENRDGNRAEREHSKFNRAPVNAVNNGIRGRDFYDTQLQQNRANAEWEQNAGKHRKTAGERNWRTEDFAMAWIVNEVRAQTPFAPER